MLLIRLRDPFVRVSLIARLPYMAYRGDTEGEAEPRLRSPGNLGVEFLCRSHGEQCE